MRFKHFSLYLNKLTRENLAIARTIKFYPTATLPDTKLLPVYVQAVVRTARVGELSEMKAMSKCTSTKVEEHGRLSLVTWVMQGNLDDVKDARADLKWVSFGVYFFDRERTFDYVYGLLVRGI